MSKTASCTITAPMRANAVMNAERYAWARDEQRRTVDAAAPWLGLADRDLWMMVTPQTLPRTIHTTRIRYTNREAVCPNCRDGIVPYGNYPWKIDAWARPWKLQCPNCGEVYPKNDFRAYYLSALDEHGIFQPGRGDAKLLYNTEHPDPKDPLHTFAVDDGYGWSHPDDGRYAFVAYYNSWGLWRVLLSAVQWLGHAYTVTDDLRYAHKAGLLLDRIADVYPDMDLYRYIHDMGFEHSDGGTCLGRIEGCIWETGYAVSLSLTYDRVFDGIARDPDLVDFLDGQAREFGLPRKDSFAAIQRNIERNLLMEFAQSIRDGRIAGNEGMHQTAMVATAVALDRQPKTTELLDWVFRPGRRRLMRKTGLRPLNGGNLPFVLHNKICRDGMGSEGAPGYCLWGHTMLTMAELLESYPDYGKHSIFHDYPKYKHCFTTPILWQCLGQATPTIGDSGACGEWSQAGVSPEVLAKAFRVYGDPLIARKLVDWSREHPVALRGSVYDRRPTDFAEQVKRAAAQVSRDLPAANLNGYGLAIVQAPAARDGRALWMSYGRNTGHGHKDRLNLGLYAENIDMLPDLGYPEYASGRPKDLTWTKNAISHNVVIVDDGPQQASHTGHLLLHDSSGKARVVYVESDGIYAGAKTYRRLSVLVDVSPGRGYVADFFWVRGGETHRQIWHGPGGELTTDGLTLIEQPRGSFAGEDVDVGQLPEDWQGNNGYAYLHGVRRAPNPPCPFWLDWDAADLRGRIQEGRDPHLRLTCLSPLSEAALALGDPPKNRIGNPKHLDYAILTRTGQDLASAFATILEPYDATPIVSSARRLEIRVTDEGVLAAAVEVQLTNGRTDTFIAAERSAEVETENGVRLHGTFGVLRWNGRRVEFARLCEGTRLSWGDFALTASEPDVRGTVKEVNTDNPRNNFVTIKFDGAPGRSVVGRLAVFENDRQHDAAYTIEGLRREGSLYRLSVGDKTLLRGYSDPRDFDSAFELNVRPGDTVRIPNSVLFPA